MPATLWSAPVEQLGNSSVSPATSTTIVDISQQVVVILAGTLSIGTRVRCRAYGNYISTTTASSIILGFYMNTTGTALTSTPAILAATASTAVANTSSASWPWMLEYEGHVRALSDPQIGSTNAQMFGQGKAYLPSSLTAWTLSAIPITAALRTVQQTATGLITSVNQTVSVACTTAVNTGLTSLTCDEFTVELLG
jgi:hypothetical protein